MGINSPVQLDLFERILVDVRSLCFRTFLLSYLKSIHDFANGCAAAKARGDLQYEIVRALYCQQGIMKPYGWIQFAIFIHKLDIF